MKSQDKGIKRIIKAFGYSYDGFIAAFVSEQAFRQDLLFCFLSTVLALLMPFSTVFKALIVAANLFILFAELVNTAIETIIDRISDDYHELSKKAKDIGSLLVLLAFVNEALIFVFAVIDLF